MNTYRFICRLTNSMHITVYAEDETQAWVVFDSKLAILETVDVFLPLRHTWSIAK